MGKATVRDVTELREEGREISTTSSLRKSIGLYTLALVKTSSRQEAEGIHGADGTEWQRKVKDAENQKVPFGFGNYEVISINQLGRTQSVKNLLQSIFRII